MPSALTCPRCGRELDPASRARGECAACRTVVETVAEGTGRASPGPATGRLAPAAPPEADVAQEVVRARKDPGRAFGPFLLLSELGKGGMGVVYRAWNDRLRRVVALKTILPGQIVDAESVERFRREAEAVARLRHPNIVAIHEAGEVAGRHYIAMDYVPGKTLERRLESKKPGERLPLNRALEAMRDVARAVDHAHRHGVVHRDLKPQNILLDAKDHPYVLDFGLARVRETGDKTRLTRSGAALGTPAYMPPEQADGAIAEMDERSDVYSLGATLYHVLAGRPPFEGQTELNVIAAVLTRDPVPPSRHNSRASGDLETICLKCLEKEKDRRYPSAEAVADEIDRYLAGEPIEARPVAGLERLVRRARRNKLQAALAVLSVCAVGAALAAGGWAIRMRWREAAEREEFVRTTREELLASTRTSAARALAAFKEKLAQARKAAPADERLEATQRRLEPLLGLGFDARDATARLAALAPEDRTAQLQAYEAAYALGEVALEAGQWSLAASAFGKARDLHADIATSASASAALHGVDKARRKLVEEHCDSVRGTIQAIRDGAASGRAEAKNALSHEDAVFALVAFREPETVQVLAKELDRLSDLLRDANRRKLLEAASPDELERGGGDEPIPGLEGAIDVWLSLPLGVHDRGVEGIFLAARKRLEDRRARRFPQEPRASLAQLIQPEQEAALGIEGAVLAGLLCESLGRCGLRAEAFPSLERYLRLECDERRAVPAALALLRLGGDESERILMLALERKFDPNGYFATQLKAAFLRAHVGAKLGADEGAVGYYMRGKTLRLNGDLAGAISDLTRALELDPRMVDAFLERGIARDSQQDLDGAFADFTRVTEIDPRNPLGWNDRGYVRVHRGEVEAGIADCSKAIEVSPRCALAWNTRSYARMILRDWEGAIADATRAIELDPDLSLAWRNRAASRRARGELEGALADLTRAIALDSRQGDVLVERASIFFDVGDTEAAIADCTRAIDMGQRIGRAWLLRGLARAKHGETAGAVADLRRYLELWPDGPDAAEARAKIEELGKSR